MSDPAGASQAGSSSTPAAPTMESWNQLSAFVAQMSRELESQKIELAETKTQLVEAKAKAAAGSTAARPNKPSPLSGKPGTVEAWCSHMDSYVHLNDPEEACRIASTYLDGEAFNWWHTYRRSNVVSDWNAFRTAIVRRFSPLNKTQAARDKLHSWRQVKDVGTFNKTFLSIVMDIPDITEEEKIDRYSRGLKRDIWRALCIKTYSELERVMTDALRVESAKVGASRSLGNASSIHAKPYVSAGVPMDISSIKVEKLTPEERQRCMREGLCLRCREKGHLAKDCPKGQRN